MTLAVGMDIEHKHTHNFVVLSTNEQGWRDGQAQNYRAKYCVFWLTSQSIAMVMSGQSRFQLIKRTLKLHGNTADSDQLASDKAS